MTPERVAAACADWIWVPDAARTVETDELLLVRFPDWFSRPLAVLRFEPRPPIDQAVADLVERARAFEVDELLWWVKLGAPAGIEERLLALGAVLDETLDVLALDLTQPPADLDVPAGLEVRWNTEAEAERDAQLVQTTVFGDDMPPEDEIDSAAARSAVDVPAGRGGALVAYLAGRSVGAAGLGSVVTWHVCGAARWSRTLAGRGSTGLCSPRGSTTRASTL